MSWDDLFVTSAHACIALACSSSITVLPAQDPEKQCFHLCIVNLVIGTLYCAKGNFEFGISRIIKSLEPYNKKLETDTWCAHA